ncbi:hypothetical protein [Paracoccus halophilus]|uniref:hypothetical protein n=1 Tax=Paracoccus halophilus TaxID=376733 RepID=UPI0012E07919|nr:hypothetical protein [Paracoccus halophilus]
MDGIFRDIDGNESIIFANLLATIRECTEAAEADGGLLFQPLDIIATQEHAP